MRRRNSVELGKEVERALRDPGEPRRPDREAIIIDVLMALEDERNELRMQVRTLADRIGVLEERLNFLSLQVYTHANAEARMSAFNLSAEILLWEALENAEVAQEQIDNLVEKRKIE